MSILKHVGKESLRVYLKECREYAKFDIDEVYELSLDLLRKHGGKQIDPKRIKKFLKLEARWYDSLQNNNPDYTVYESALYFSELWLCWTKYSRDYFKRIIKKKSAGTKSIIKDIGDCRSVIDLGCGVGFTTQALKEIFPKARVIGTNLKDTPQFKMAEKRGRQHEFCMQEKLVQSDLVFASEYFEHWENPVEHLIEVLETCKPRYLLIANAFTGYALGHFNFYYHQKRKYNPKEISKLFATTLRSYGYEKMKTTCWNNRPAYWKLTKRNKNKGLIT